MRATITIDGAPVTLLPKRAPVGNSGPIRGRPLAVFAAEVIPPSTLPDAAAEAVRLPATIGPGGLPGIAVFDLTESEAGAAARALGVRELLYWDGRRARLLMP